MYHLLYLINYYIVKLVIKVNNLYLCSQNGVNDKL